MKNYLFALAIIGICSSAHSQNPTPLPPDSAELVAKYKRWKEEEHRALEAKVEEKRLAVIKALLAQIQNATKKGNLNGALAIEGEVKILKEEDLRNGLLKLMQGKWEWNTGATVEFGQKGKMHDGALALWVIDPRKRLLYYRTKDDNWHYDIILSEDGDSFTAKRIQSGKVYSAKRIPN